MGGLGFVLLMTLMATMTVTAAAKCDCYHTSNNDYFSDYSFHDFRNVSTASPIPSINSQTTGIGKLQGGFLSSETFNQSWGIQSWGKNATEDFPIPMLNSLSNVFIDSSSLDQGEKITVTSKLVLRTKRFQDHQLAAELEHDQNNILHASLRVRARVVGDPGAVAGIFFFRNDQNESDIEILTRDADTKIRYTNQPSVDADGNEVPGSSTQVDLTTGEQIDAPVLDSRGLVFRARDDDAAAVKHTDWHTHRLDWTAQKTSWYLDDRHMLDKTYGVPSLSSQVILNMWSDGGTWSGNMSVDHEARLEIEWVEIAYNTSGPVRDEIATDAQGKCKHVCRVDETDEKGILQGGFMPEQGSSAIAAAGGGGGAGGAWLLLLMTLTGVWHDMSYLFG